MVDDQINNISYAVIGAAIEVHRVLGPGFLESAYENAMCEELTLRGTAFERQVTFDVNYKNKRVSEGRIDLLVEKKLVVELKTVDSVAPIHVAQAMSYLKALDLQLALVINFKATVLTDGVRRVSRFQ